MPKRILVAEDDMEMRRIVVDALRTEGYEVIEAADGKELLTLLIRARDREPIDLIVTDVRMPGWSGLDLLSVLRDAEWTTPMIVMTSFGDRETRARAAELGALLLDKPLRLDMMITAIRRCLA
jgi:DNA-binding response OmpR family regulator